MLNAAEVRTCLDEIKKLIGTRKSMCATLGCILPDIEQNIQKTTEITTQIAEKRKILDSDENSMRGISITEVKESLREIYEMNYNEYIMLIAKKDSFNTERKMLEKQYDEQKQTISKLDEDIARQKKQLQEFTAILLSQKQYKISKSVTTNLKNALFVDRCDFRGFDLPVSTDDSEGAKFIKLALYEKLTIVVIKNNIISKIYGNGNNVAVLFADDLDQFFLAE